MPYDTLKYFNSLVFSFCLDAGRNRREILPALSVIRILREKKLKLIKKKILKIFMINRVIRKIKNKGRGSQDFYLSIKKNY